MKLKVSSTLLQKKLDHLCKISKAKTTIPVLDYIKMEVTDDVITLTASDLEVTLVTTIVPEEVASVGSTCVLADKFTEVIKNTKDCILELSLDDKNNIIIKSKSGKFKIPCMPSDDFPMLHEPKEENIIDIASDVIVRGLNKTDFAVYKSDGRPQMCGVNFDFKENKTVSYATDGVKIAAYFSEQLVSFPSSVVFPTKLASVVKSLAAEATSNVQLCFDDKNIKIDLTEYIIYSKKIEGEYPNYDPTLNMEVDVILSASREELADALKRSLTFANEYSLVAINVLIGRFTIAAENINYGLSAEEDVFCENKEGSGFFKVNGRFLLEILQRISSEEIEISFSEKTPIVYINPLDKTENCLFGLMKYAN